MALRLDIEGITNEILNKLEEELQWAFEAWETESYSRLKEAKFADRAVIEAEVKRNSKSIIAFLKANKYAIADSYGTGSLMLNDIPGLQEYRNSNEWNPARTGKEIVGRPKGKYKDFFGEERVSFGHMEGKNIEGLELYSGDVIEPTSPSYALQDAENFLYVTYLPRAYSNAVKSINFGKFLIES